MMGHSTKKEKSPVLDSLVLHIHPRKVPLNALQFPLTWGLGGMAVQLNKQGGNLHDYWRKFTMRLKKRGLVDCDGLRPSGYSYFLRGGVETACDRNAYLVGDAVGLATRDMCEGIGPAIESALLAARSIVTGSDYSLAGIAQLSGQSVISRHLERKFAG